MPLDTLKHHNWDYVGDIPVATGDRYYAQDMTRDRWFEYQKSSVILRGLYANYPILLEDSYVVKGTAWNQIDIPSVGGIINYDVKVPDSFASIPPTTKFETIAIKVITEGQSDYTMSSATLDGVSTNYVKVRYTEINGNSRNRAKKAGSYVYEKQPHYIITVDTTVPSDYHLVLAEIVGDGATFLNIDRKRTTRLRTAVYGYHVTKNTLFKQIIERVAANQYRFKTGLSSIHFAYKSGGYDITSILEGGDTWGYIETNNCVHLDFEKGTYIDLHGTPSYIEVNTSQAKLENVWLKDNTVITSAAIDGFKLNAISVTFENCVYSTKVISGSLVAFRGASDPVFNLTSKYINCLVSNLSGDGNLRAFSLGHNIINALIYNIDVLGIVYGFYQCEQLTNCKATNINKISGSISTYGFYQCEQLTNCKATNINTYPPVYGFRECNEVVSCKAIDNSSANSLNIGFSGCKSLSSCLAENLDSNTTSEGFNLCEVLSACRALDITSTGVAEGFKNCNYGAALYTDAVINSGNDWIDTVDIQVTNKVSTPSVWT